MHACRWMGAAGAAGLMVAWIGAGRPLDAAAQAPDKTAIIGAWTLNKDLSDTPPERGRGDEGSGRRGGGGGGGYGRGGGMGAGMSEEDRARMRDAMRAVMVAPEHLTITGTDTMFVLTTQDGLTTRLSPDGQKIKDENTKIERKTKWDGDKLVSEISGLGSGKITETYAIDPEHHQLHVTVQTEGGRSKHPMTANRVYDADAR